MTQYKKISGRDDIVRDAKTGAILRCDKTKLMEAKRVKREKERYINLEKRIEELEKMVQILLKGNSQ